METIKPTAVFTPFSGRVEIRMYGKPHNWSLKGINSEADLEANSALRDDLMSVALESGSWDIFCPDASKFNVKVCTYTELENIIPLAGTFTPKLWRGREAEGIVLPDPKGNGGKNPVGLPAVEGAWFATADCAVVVLHSSVTGKTVAFHAGRDSLIERAFVMRGKQKRDHASVVDAAMAQFTLYEKCFLRAFICGATRAHFHQNDPAHAEYNGKLREYLSEKYPDSYGESLSGDLEVSIQSIIVTQLIRRHTVIDTDIGLDCIDIDDHSAEGDHLWWSHQRWFQKGQEGVDGRNGIFVIRKW